LQLMTDSDPANEQIPRYTKILEVPYVGPTEKMRKVETVMANKA
jgi:hypothetical protein